MKGMPGIGLEIDGAVQQAPQPGRQIAGAAAGRGAPSETVSGRGMVDWMTKACWQQGDFARGAPYNRGLLKKQAAPCGFPKSSTSL